MYQKRNLSGLHTTNFFHSLHHANRSLLWINNLFLMWLCLIPFVTGLIGDYPGSKTGAFLYGTVATFTAASFLWMRWYAFSRAKLYKLNIPDSVIRKTLIKSSLSPLLHLLGTAFAVLITYSPILMFAAIAVYYIFPTPTDQHDNIRSKKKPNQ